jgi:hypothetical protein
VRSFLNEYSKDNKAILVNYVKTIGDAYKGVLGYDFDVLITTCGEYINLALSRFGRNPE